MSKGHHHESILLIFRSKKYDLLDDALSHLNLMIALLGVDGDYPQLGEPCPEHSHCCVASRDRILKELRNPAESPVRDAHLPDELLHLVDVLLMRFSGQHDLASPCTAAWANPPVVKEGSYMIHNTRILVRPKRPFVAVERRRRVGVNGKLIVQYSPVDTLRTEKIPILND